MHFAGKTCFESWVCFNQQCKDNPTHTNEGGIYAEDRILKLCWKKQEKIKNTYLKKHPQTAAASKKTGKWKTSTKKQLHETQTLYLKH